MIDGMFHSVLTGVITLIFTQGSNVKEILQSLKLTIHGHTKHETQNENILSKSKQEQLRFNISKKS